jgi:hypothetical protein
MRPKLQFVTYLFKIYNIYLNIRCCDFGNLDVCEVTHI